MLNRALLLVCLMVLLHPPKGFAEDTTAPEIMGDPIQQNKAAWQNLQDYEDTRFFAIAGPPMLEEAERSRAETQLFEDMVENFDNLEDEDDEYLFVIEALFDPEDSSRPASLRNDDDIDEATLDRNDAPIMNTSMYIDAVRPTFLPGVQIKPRDLEPDKKENSDVRSLFSDLLKPKADQILDDIKPIVAIAPDGTPQASPDQNAKPDGAKAGNINAPPKKRIVSPDEETLIQLKQAVKELGLEKNLNLGSGADGHQVLEHQKEDPSGVQANNGAAKPPLAEPIAAQKPPVSAIKNNNVVKKKAVKPRKRAKPQPKAVPVEPPPEKEESIFDIF